MSHISAQAMTLPGRSSPSTSAAASFEDLAMPLFDSAYNFAYWLARDRDDAEDLVQETYLKAFRGFASFRSGTNFRAWMFQILKNTFLCARAQKQRREDVMLSPDEVSELPAGSDDIESILSDRSRLDGVQGAIDQLPVIFREVLLLCDVEEASYREIAEILSIPIGTVMSRLARARKSVRESLRAKPSVGLNESWSQRPPSLEDDSRYQNGSDV